MASTSTRWARTRSTNKTITIFNTYLYCLTVHNFTGWAIPLSIYHDRDGRTVCCLSNHWPLTYPNKLDKSAAYWLILSVQYPKKCQKLNPYLLKKKLFKCTYMKKYLAGFNFTRTIRTLSLICIDCFQFIYEVKMMLLLPVCVIKTNVGTQPKEITL